MRMTVEVADNVLRFLKDLSGFTGEDPTAIIEREIKSIPKTYLDCWDGSLTA